MKTHLDITKELMEMIEIYCLAQIPEDVLKIKIKNLLLVWETEILGVSSVVVKSNSLNSCEFKSINEFLT